MAATYHVVMTTTAQEDTAFKLARFAVEERLAACANVVKNINSIYYWEGEIHDDPEFLIMFKTAEPKTELLMKKIRELHPYQIPEIISIPITDGDPVFLRWIFDWVSAEI